MPAAQGLQGLAAFVTAQGLHALFTAQGLQDLRAPQGPHLFLAADGLQADIAAQGRHAFPAPQGFATAHGLPLRCSATRRGTSQSVAIPAARHGLQGLPAAQGLLVFAAAHGLPAFFAAQGLPPFLAAHGAGRQAPAASRISRSGIQVRAVSVFPAATTPTAMTAASAVVDIIRALLPNIKGRPSPAPPSNSDTTRAIVRSSPADGPVRPAWYRSRHSRRPSPFPDRSPWHAPSTR